MDPETMHDDIANVGIKDGRIAAITKDKITGKETINANGLVVAPGFIDMLNRDAALRDIPHERWSLGFERDQGTPCSAGRR